MMKLSYEIIHALQGRTLATAESCTGGGIGAALTEVPGSSAVYKGGIISYTNDVKTDILGVDCDVLEQYGAVSEKVAEMMATGALKLLKTDFTVSVTGLAGPSGDGYGNPVGTVYIGFADKTKAFAKRYHFSGDREEIRHQAVIAALELVKSQI